MNTVPIVAIHDIMPLIAADTGDIKSKIRTAMTATKDHWLVTDESVRFSTAVLAVAQYCSDSNLTEDHDRILWELDILTKLSNGYVDGVDMDKYEALGLLAMWREVHR